MALLYSFPGILKKAFTTLPMSFQSILDKTQDVGMLSVLLKKKGFFQQIIQNNVQNLNKNN